MGRMRKMRGSIAVSIGVFFCLFSSALSEASERAGRIFYVTTTTSLSTVNTISFCHMLSVTNTVMGTCSARKRKSFTFNDQPFVNPTEEISPSVLDIDHLHQHHHQIHGHLHPGLHHLYSSGLLLC